MNLSDVMPPRRSASTYRWIVALLFVGATAVGLAQGATELDRASAQREAVEASTDVSTAELDLEAAQRDRSRVEADPTSLRVSELRVRHAVEAAEDAVRNARAAARDAGADAFEAALQARDRVALAEAALAIASTEARAAQIRLDAGAATESDVARAADAARASDRDLADARRAYALALDQLALRLGRTEIGVVLQPIVDDPDVPALDEVLPRVAEHAGLRRAVRAVELAEAQLAAVDVAFVSARADVEAAEDALATAELRASDLESTVRLAIRQAYNAVLGADARLVSADEALATAEQDVEVAAIRFEAGSIAQVVLERVRLDRLRRMGEVHAARMALADALRSLDATILGVGR